MKFILKLTCVLFFLSCQNPKSNIDSEIITRKSLTKSHKLKGEVVTIKDLLIPFRHNVIRDSLLLVENYTPNPYYFEMYNIKNNQKLLEFGRRGKGPNELLSGKFIANAVNSKNQKELFIHDVVGKKITEYNIDSLLLKKDAVNIIQTDVPDFVSNFSKLDKEKFLCHNLYSLDDSKFGNDIDEIFIFSRYDLKKPDVSACKFFTFNVSGAIVLSSLSENRIVVANQYSNRLDFYDTKLQHIKRIEGPDLVNVEYEKRNENQIYFKKGKSFLGYSAGVSVGKSVYLIYEGVTDYKFETAKTLPKVEVYKYNWNGKLLSHFILDRFIYTISVTSDEKFLYGTSIDLKGKQILVKYKLF